MSEQANAVVLDNLTPQLLQEGKGTCYLIHASTGCSCCREDNFIEGPWRTEEAVKARIESLKGSRRLSSQYSDTGQYSMLEVEYERAGEWLILDGQYAIKGTFIEDDEDRWDYEISAFKKDYRL